jgi:hypothetical protein
MGVPADYTDDATASTAARCFLEPDLLAEALCEGAGPSAWVFSIDLMLDELVASFVVSRQAITLVPGCMQAAAIAS